MQNGQRFRRELRGHDHFAENFRDGLGHGGIERLVHGNDAAERRLLVGGKRLVPRLAQIRALTDPARIRVLQNGQRGEITPELGNERGGGREVQNVVVGQFLAVELMEIVVELAIERSSLVRIFAIAQRLRQRGGDGQHLRQGVFIGGKFLLQMCGNRGIVGGRTGIDLGGQLAAHFQGGIASLGDQSGHLGIIRRIHNDRDTVMILGRAAQHGRTADVDVLNRIMQAHVGLGHGGFEGIEIHHHQVNRRNAVRFHRALVRGVATNVEQAAVDKGMQRLHAAVEHLRKAGVIADVLDRQPGLPEGLGGAAGGDQFHPVGGQYLGKGDEAGFIGNREQSALDFHARKNLRQERFRQFSNTRLPPEGRRKAKKWRDLKQVINCQNETRACES